MTALDDLNEKVTKLEDRLDALSKQVVIVGTIVPYGGESEPGDGWLLCDGRALERAKYPDLYRVIGANFGAPDKTRFNLPDLRGRFVRGVDRGQGRDPDAVHREVSAEGGNSGDQVGSLQEDACQSHSHQYKTTSWFYRESEKGKQYILGNPNGDRGSLGESVGDGLHHDKTDPPDESVRQSTETRPKNVYVNWIIYAGV